MNVSSATWSAIAASFSAVAAFLIWRVQRRNFYEWVRPELVLADFSRREEGSGDKLRDVITFSKLRNVGHGAASNIDIFPEDHRRDDPSTFAMENKRIPILASNEDTGVNGDIIIWWKNVKRDKYLFIDIRIRCWDTSGRCHETPYNLFVVEQTGTDFVVGATVPGVRVDRGRTITTPRWRLRLVNSAVKNIWVLIVATLILCSTILGIYLATQ